MLPPLLVMLALIVVTAAAAWTGRLIRHRRSARVAALAAAWRMSYTHADRFDITPTVAARFPTPGAADVVLRDLIYGPDAADSDSDSDAGLRYLFTVEYTTGVLRTKRRRMGVAMLVEPAAITHGPAAPTPRPVAITLAPATLSLAEQYAHLRAGPDPVRLTPASPDSHP
jgi:hypothetical protein